MSGYTHDVRHLIEKNYTIRLAAQVVTLSPELMEKAMRVHQGFAEVLNKEQLNKAEMIFAVDCFTQSFFAQAYRELEEAK